ncbi:MAG: Asp-tRNA(Asn)/Glu-tRNA(Gln) amidotransferase subunit GatC [Lachnospiraceae bacterium]|nr:Asp-tRNA(Asn)/Glu-tRNA(Gln) amidotransferase subunit GatC [Lachnospiraceae bacterium]
MRQKIDEETVAYVSKLSQLELTAEEKRAAAADMEECLTMMDILSGLDTRDGEELLLYDNDQNVLREDERVGSDMADSLLRCAPLAEDGLIPVPKTV